MGKRFREPDQNNPDGYWEDLDFKELNERLIAGHMHIDDWRYEISKITSCRVEPWGLKDPRLCYLLGLYLELLRDVHVIRASRNVSSVAESMSRNYRWSFAESMIEAERRERLLDRQCPKDTQTINFDRRWSEEELYAHIEADQGQALPA